MRLSTYRNEDAYYRQQSNSSMSFLRLFRTQLCQNLFTLITQRNEFHCTCVLLGHKGTIYTYTKDSRRPLRAE